MYIMKALLCIAFAVVSAHGNIVPLHQVRNIQQVQSEAVSNTHTDDYIMPNNQEQSRSVATSTNTKRCGTVGEDPQRTIRHMLQNQHLKDKMKNNYQKENKVHEDFICICPYAADFAPCLCDCDGEYGEGRIDCSGITDVNELKIKFQTTHFPVNKYGMFHSSSYKQPINTSNPEVPSLPDNVFNEVSFKKIHFTFGVFQNVHPEAFISSFDTLEELFLTCSDHLIYFPDLMEFPYLNRLSLSSSSIELIPVISPQPSLIYLNIDSNGIKNVTPYAFENLPKLQELDLGRNKLTTLEKNTMHLISDTPTIYMDSNNIGFIDDEAFSGDEEKNQPGYLDLISNNLTSLQEPVFRKILELVSHLMLDGGGVYVNDNPLDCNTLSWLMNLEDLQKYLLAPQCMTYP